MCFYKTIHCKFTFMYSTHTETSQSMGTFDRQLPTHKLAYFDPRIFLVIVLGKGREEVH